MNVQCADCPKEIPIGEVTPSRFVRPVVANLIGTERSEWDADSLICHEDLNRFRSQYVQSVMTEEKGELTTRNC